MFDEHDTAVHMVDTMPVYIFTVVLCILCYVRAWNRFIAVLIFFFFIINHLSTRLLRRIYIYICTQDRRQSLLNWLYF